MRLLRYLSIAVCLAIAFVACFLTYSFFSGFRIDGVVDALFYVFFAVCGMLFCYGLFLMSFYYIDQWYLNRLYSAAVKTSAKLRLPDANSGSRILEFEIRNPDNFHVTISEIGFIAGRTVHKNGARIAELIPVPAKASGLPLRLEPGEAKTVHIPPTELKPGSTVGAVYFDIVCGKGELDNYAVNYFAKKKIKFWMSDDGVLRRILRDERLDAFAAEKLTEKTK